MSPMSGRRVWMVAGMLAMSAALVRADVVVLRNGQRLVGELVAVRNGVVEFEEQDRRSRRLVRLDRREVDRIEFDRDSIFDRDRDRDSIFDRDRGRDEDRDRDRGPGGPPRGARERVVTVSADVPWNDTGVDVRSGQEIYFSAQGRVKWGPDRRDGPEGESGSPFNGNRPIPNRPAAALIGRVGNGDAFFIGSDSSPIRMRGNGRLYLGINDDFLQDNSGNFRVTVSY
ncbi:MAG: hypothetical protein U0Q12_03710 [Vicinamibacterales bacterium]